MISRSVRCELQVRLVAVGGSLVGVDGGIGVGMAGEESVKRRPGRAFAMTDVTDRTCGSFTLTTGTLSTLTRSVNAGRLVAGVFLEWAQMGIAHILTELVACLFVSHDERECRISAQQIAVRRSGGGRELRRDMSSIRLARARSLGPRPARGVADADT